MYTSNLRTSQAFHKLGERIIKTTNKNDSILAWGHVRTLYLITDREGVGRYVNHNLLFLRGYSSIVIETFYADLVKKPPKYIIDETPLQYSYPSFDKKRIKQWIPTKTVYEVSKEFDIVASYLETNYYLSETLENGWRIYKRNGT